jgi:serine/threonine protein kinase
VRSGSLEAYLESKPDLLITESIAQFYIANVLLGLKHIHDQRIIQRDIKPDNLLLADNGYLKLTDFGISASTSKQSTTTSMKSGTLRYMAPEMFCKIPRHNYLVDIYATGIVMFELLYRKVPYDRGLKQAGPFVDKAKKEDPQPTEIPKGYDIKFIDLPATKSQPSDDCKNAVEQMTHVWPWRRIGVAGGMDGGVKEVLDHAFFKNIDCNAILAQTLPAPIVPDADGRAVAQQTEDVMDLFGEEEKDQTILTEKQLTIIKNLEEKLSAINLIERQKGEVQESSSAGS